MGGDDRLRFDRRELREHEIEDLFLRLPKDWCPNKARRRLRGCPRKGARTAAGCEEFRAQPAPRGRPPSPPRSRRRRDRRGGRGSRARPARRNQPERKVGASPTACKSRVLPPEFGPVTISVALPPIVTSDAKGARSSASRCGL